MRASRALLQGVRRHWFAAPLFAVLVLLVIVPFGVLAWTSFNVAPPHLQEGTELTLGNYGALASSSSLEATWNTVIVATFATLIAVGAGAVLAWLAVRTDIPGKGVAHAAGLVPLFLSPLVGALAWSLLASPRSGYLNLLLNDLGLDWRINIYSLGGIIFVCGLYYTPYSYLFTYSALSLMNPELEQSARVHGANTFHVLRKVTLPLLAPALVGVGLLIFILASENFPVPQILGAPNGIEVLSSRVFHMVAGGSGRHSEAAALGILLMVIISLVLVMQSRLMRRRSYVTVSGKGLRPERVRLGRWRWPAFGFALLYLCVAGGLPFFALTMSALREHQFVPDLAALFATADLSLDTFQEVLDYRPFQQSISNTLIVAIAAAVFGGLLHFTLAYTAQRTRLIGRGFLPHIARLPLAMPSVVIGMGFLWTWATLPFPVYGTLLVIILAFMARFLPQGYEGISASLLRISPELEEAAATSGAGRVTVLRRITMPLIRTGLFSTMFLLFTLALRELTTAIFLFTADTRLLSIVIYDQWESGFWPRVAAISLMYSAILLIVTIIGRRWLAVRQVGG